MTQAYCRAHAIPGREIGKNVVAIETDDCGIRARIQGPNEAFRVFYTLEEGERGLPNLINCIGIESPRLTSTLDIA